MTGVSDTISSNILYTGERLYMTSKFRLRKFIQFKIFVMNCMLAHVYTGNVALEKLIAVYSFHKKHKYNL